MHSAASEQQQKLLQPLLLLMLLLLLLLSLTCSTAHCQLQKQQKQQEKDSSSSNDNKRRQQASTCSSSSNSVCNGIVHYPDRTIDQGLYCSGCGRCGVEVPVNGDNSFVWRHYEHPNMLVQFITCSPLPRKRLCAVHDRRAAVFVSPYKQWNLSLHQMFCECPAEEGEAAVHHLKSWKLENLMWYYEFSCTTPQCDVTHEDSSTSSSSQSGSGGEVCAVKRRANEKAPTDVEFKCACPQTHHCTVVDLNIKNDEQKKEQQHEEKVTWLQDSASGGEYSERLCTSRARNLTLPPA